MPGLALAAALLCTVSTATAQERARVVLLQARAGSSFSVEILSRLRGELAASNVELHVLPAPASVPPKEAVQGEWPDVEPDVVLLVQEQREGNRRTEEIWLSDRLERRLFVQRVNADPAEPARSARWVAVQAAELVRARMAESIFSRGKAVASPEPALAPPLVLAPELRKTSLTAGFGVGLLHGFHGLADTWAPMARVSVSLFDGALSYLPLALDARASGGLGVARGIVYGERTASTRQSFALLEMVARFAPESLLEPQLSIGCGGYSLAVDGSSAAPFRNHSQSTWSGISTFGAGLRLAPLPGAALLLDATLIDVWSKTNIRFGSDDVLRVGAPMALFAATAMGVF